jgi:hypothetical protein
MTAPEQKKLKISGPVVITANRLADGAVVYRLADGSWSVDIAGAAVTRTADEASKWLAAAATDGNVAVGAYVAPVTHDDQGRAGPGNLRERIRATGPTVDLPTIRHN